MSFRFIYVPCPHTSDVLTDVLIDAMLGWNVDQDYPQLQWIIALPMIV